MSDPSTIHIPVLLDEILEWLRPSEGSILVDGTLGGGGHARKMVELVGATGCVVGVDRDPKAIAENNSRLSGLPVKTAVANFCEIPEVLEEAGIETVDGILLDLGLSSDQLADSERGFSFNSTGTLDLRFNPEEGEPAYKLVARLSEAHLADLIYQYGEERKSRRIAKALVETRKFRELRTAAEFAEVIRSAVPKKHYERIDPATRTFQALRIAVNDELKSLETALRRLPDCLAPGGRLAIISFHSLEDRRVKQAFLADERLRILTKKPITASPVELERNPRSRSAKLRIAERLGSPT